jgi:hypothetical protein
MEAGSMRVAGEKRESFLHFRFRCKKIRNDLLEPCSSLSYISLAFFLSLSLILIAGLTLRGASRIVARRPPRKQWEQLVRISP